ncbi:hypothetical protein [Bartonella sp. AP31XZML]|uniref:hypothetical protein n=1 Tax=Bartonella sp. AP31XZML TaxID=3243488 RepID=UPI0035CEAB72
MNIPTCLARISKASMGIYGICSHSLPFYPNVTASRYRLVGIAITANNSAYKVKSIPIKTCFTRL